MEEKDDRTEKLKGVQNKAEVIEKGIGKARTTIKDYGLCTNCINFICIENDFGDAIVKCDWFELRFGKGVITKNKPVTNCSKFWDKKFTQIRDLEAIAWLIDSKPNEQIGFLKPSYVKRWSTYD